MMTRQTSLEALADAAAERRRLLAWSLRQMVRAGLAYAMVPDELGTVADISLALAELVDDDGATDGRFGNLCAAQWRPDGAGDTVTWVCLQPRCPSRPDWGDWEPVGLVTVRSDLHGWPSTPAARDRERAALHEQVDPVARIERRVAFALEGASAHPLLVEGMPTACP